MRQFRFLLLLLFAVAFAGCEPEFEEGELPIIRIDTETGIRPDPKQGAMMEVELGGKTLLKHRIGIEMRGKTSYRLSDKKSYGFEAWNDAGEPRDISVLGLPEESDWILMGHVYRDLGEDNYYVWDPSLMHHYISYEIARASGRYAARCRWVEVEIDGQYEGVYVLMEKPKSTRWRIDINDPGESGDALTGGYILKIDKASSTQTGAGVPVEYFDNNWNDDATYTGFNSFRSDYDIHGEELTFEPYLPAYHPEQTLETYYLYEQPAANEITQAQRTYIQNYIHDFETAIKNDDFSAGEHSYHEYIDLESFADYFLVNEIGANVDAYRLSTFLHKPRGKKLMAGPVWDFNLGYGRVWRTPTDEWIVNYNDYVSGDAWSVQFWWPKLLEDPAFRAVVKARWNELREGPWSNSAIIGLVDETALRLRTTGAYERNYQRWRTENTTVDYESSQGYLVDYLRNRLEFMDNEIGSW